MEGRKQQILYKNGLGLLPYFLKDSFNKVQCFAETLFLKRKYGLAWHLHWPCIPEIIFVEADRLSEK